MADDRDLDRLAPSVDTDQARASFHRRQHRSRAYRHGALATAAVAVLAVGTVAMVANLDTEKESVVAGPVDLAGPTCEQIKHFAERIKDVGITYDYNPSESPEALMGDSDVVVVGQLTGETATYHAEDAEDPYGSDLVGYQIDVRTVFKAVGGGTSDPMYVWIEVSPTMDLAPFEEAAVAGVPVVAFGYQTTRAPGYEVAIEGLVTGCPGGPIVGRVGTEGEWVTVTDLDDVDARLDAAAGP